MSDCFTSEQRHRNMAAIRSINTKPELLLRKALWHKGLRYKTNSKQLPGAPDIVLPKYHSVVFVHGCFWHGHKNCKRYSVPKTNTDYWRAKVARNQERDQEVWRQLEAKGWAVIIVWECELTKVRYQETVERVFANLHRNEELYHSYETDRKKAQEEYKKRRKEHKEKEDMMLAESKQIRF